VGAEVAAELEVAAEVAVEAAVVVETAEEAVEAAVEAAVVQTLWAPVHPHPALVPPAGDSAPAVLPCSAGRRSLSPRGRPPISAC
jgi:hypothetical protein